MIKRPSQSKQLLFRSLLVVFIILSIIGIFDRKALEYLEKAAQQNVEFLSVVAGVQLVVDGISSMDIPFISGNSEGIENTLGKVETYLLITDALVFIQVLVVTLTKSLMFKIMLVVLFALSLFEKKQSWFLSKILVLSLALSPGLSMYTMCMHKMTSEVSVSYGVNYLEQLKKSTQTIKQENAQLMKEHMEAESQADDGKKRADLWQKLKSDVHYDVEKAGNYLKGDYKEIQTLIKTAGHDMVANISRFCTMVLFSFLLLPLGYALIVYVLFNSLFKKNVLIVQKTEVEKTLKSIT
jgi:hypothetical protein